MVGVFVQVPGRWPMINFNNKQETYGCISRVEALNTEKKNQYTQKRVLAKQMAAEVKELKALYKEHLSIARFVYRNDTFMQDQLELKGTRKGDWAGWLAQVLEFYTKVETLALAVMKKNGATAEDLARGKAIAAAMMAAYVDKKSNKGDAQSATKRRDEVLKAIDSWVSSFKKVARVALEKDPQLLEVLGIVVPSVR